jgi:SPP1 family predicted phage head-tail adaptor
MKTSDYRQRITFLERLENAKDKDGYRIPEDKAWKSVKTVWAAIKTIQGREFYQAATIQAERTTRFVIRYSKSMEALLNNKMRVQYKNRIFEIESIINDNEANVTFTIMTSEVL